MQRTVLQFGAIQQKVVQCGVVKSIEYTAILHNVCAAL